MLKLAFFKGNGSAINGIIRWRTNSIYSHVELVFSDGEAFSAQLHEGTRFKKIEFNQDWDLVEVPGINEVKVKDFCGTVLGRRYDFRGIVDFFANVTHGDDGDWFCSEVCVTALQEAGFCLRIPPHLTSPGSLFDLAFAYGCGYIEGTRCQKS